jgi:DNA-binding SARP family transcriptional activator
MEFRILGPLEIATADGLVELRGVKPRAVLALLLVHANEVVSAERLIDDLWEGDPPRSATTTLQTYVSQLRKQLGFATLETRSTGYRLHVPSGGLDAQSFEQRVAEVERAVAPRPSWIVERLDGAFRLWRGPALADFAGLHWAEPEIARLEGLRLAALEESFEARLALGQDAHLVGELEILVAEHPLRERLWGQLMLALYRAGRQADSLRSYARVRDILIEDLGVDPGPELRALERAVLAQDPSLTAPTRQGGAIRTPGLPSGTAVPVPPALTSAATQPFVGRNGELARLADFEDALRDGVARLMLIVGEPGIGKTGLAARAALAAREGGATVLVGRCDEQAIRAYQPFAEAFHHYVRHCMLDSGNPHLERMATEFAPLLPELAGEFPDEPPTAGGGAARLQLFENLASFLGRLADTGPVVVLLDDLHWADTSTLRLLRHLITRPQPAGVLYLATVRHTEPSGRAVLNELVDLRRDGVVERLTLSGLREDDVMTLLTPMTGNVEDQERRAWARELREWTNGNPLFIEELLRDLNDGAAFDHPRRPHLDKGLVPEDLKNLIVRRVTRLSDRAGHALAVAAVAGPRFAVDIVEAVAGLPGEELLAAVEEAEVAGIIVEDGDEVGLYRFSHALVRDALYAQLSALRRARMHRRVGEALETLRDNDADGFVAELALHFCLGSPRDARAVHYARRAGDRAMGQLAFEQAADAYLAALDVQSHLSSPGVEDHSEALALQVQTVLALARAGATDRAQERFESFGLGARDLAGAPPGIAEDVAALQARLTKDRGLAACGAEREALARESAALYEQIFDRLQRPYACINAATMWLVAGDPLRSTRLAKAARRLASETATIAAPDSYWLAATEAEAALLLDDIEGASEALARAVAQPTADVTTRMVTRKQLELVCATKGIDAAVLGALSVAGDVIRSV